MRSCRYLSIIARLRLLPVVAVLFLFASSVGASSTQPGGIFPPDNDPLPIAYKQSLFAGFTEDRVGTAVSISGGLLAVGVPGNDTGQTFDTGRVDVYRWLDEAAGWVLFTSYTTQSFGITQTANARFGAAVSISRDWLLIGCPGCIAADDTKAILVRVPEVIEGANQPLGGLEAYRLSPPSLGDFNDPVDGTGAAVALNVVNAGTILNPTTSVAFAVGSPAATFGNFTLGAVAMGNLVPGVSGVDWEFGPTYGTADFGKYGASLAMSAATWIDTGIFRNERDLVVGQPGWVPNGGSGIPGQASLWKRVSGSWSLFQNFEAPSPGFLDALGSAVASERISNDSLGTIALGAPGRSLNGTPGGSVIVFRQAVVDGTYQFDQEFQHPDAETADRFGGALALSNNRLLVGADGRAVDLNNNAGSVYVYRYELNQLFNYSWVRKQTLIEPRESGGNSAFGFSVAIGPRAAAIGAPLSDAAGLSNAGRVATYLCDRIFADGLEGNASTACSGP